MLILIVFLSKLCFILASRCELMSLGPQNIGQVKSKNCTINGPGWRGVLDNVEKEANNSSYDYKLGWGSLIEWPECVEDVKIHFKYHKNGKRHSPTFSISFGDYSVAYSTQFKEFILTIEIYSKTEVNSCFQAVTEIAPLETLYSQADRPKDRASGGRGFSGGNAIMSAHQNSF